MALVLPSLVMVAMIFPYCHTAWSKVFISVSAFFVGSGSGGLCFLVLRAAFHPLGQNKRAWKHALSVPTKAQKAVRFFFFIFIFSKKPPICFPTIGLSHSGASSFPFLPDSWLLECWRWAMAPEAAADTSTLLLLGSARCGCCCRRHTPFVAVHVLKSHLLLLVSGFNGNFPLTQ